MGIGSQTVSVPPQVRSVLSGLRWRIRGFVLLDGLILAIGWLAGTFWVSLAADYLPILAGASELPAWVRAIMLAVVLLSLLYIVHRWIVARITVPLSDRSLAILLERRFPAFRDGLVTTVELLGRPADIPISAELLRLTTQEADSELGNVRLRDVFAYASLRRKSLLAVLLVGSVGVFGVLDRSTLALAANRLWLLDASPWPRNAQIEVLGVEVLRATSSGSMIPVTSTMLSFADGRVKVAKGSSLSLKVRADASARVVPESCVVAYATSLDEYGRVKMDRVGDQHAEEVRGRRVSVQNYVYDGKPFKGILSDVNFSVIGYDHRLSNFQIEVVESPALAELVLECELPEYIALAENQPRHRELTYLPSGTQVPVGTHVTFRAVANKPLRQVYVARSQDQPAELLQGPFANDGRELRVELGDLRRNTTVELTMLDTDMVSTERPIRVTVAVVPDEPPQIDVRLRGIGRAVTPDVLMPMQGTIKDEYGVASSWLELQQNDKTPNQLALTLDNGGALNEQFDFRRMRQEAGGLGLKPQDKLLLQVGAEDICDLDGKPNVRLGNSIQLDVVTAGELLVQLETRELGLRQRFEQVIEELTETRDTLLRVKVEGLSGDAAQGAEAAPEGVDPGDAQLDPQTVAERVRSLRLLRVQKSTQQCQKSSQEVLGIAVSFEDIREEMINNRLEAAERIELLREKITIPLRAILNQEFKTLQSRLTALEEIAPRLADPAEVVPSIQATEILLNRLSEVLQEMLDIESYNELLDLVRGMIKEQDELIRKTKEQKKQQLLKLSE
ncbi:MAG: DUF4175 domain-containing protein [Planctomycetes bacterium]|nr:DUF4175 domain-containing protein [Planctomycetota bacterium]